VAQGILGEMTRADFRSFNPELAALPIGATEVHGDHLPFGNDTLTVAHLTRDAVQAANAKGARVLALPAIPYGMDANLMEFPYTMTIRPTTLMALVGDLVDSLAHHGVRKLLLVNGHGGNTGTLEAIYRELYDRGVFIAAINAWATAPEVMNALVKTKMDHACEFETSLSLALHPELVQMDEAKESPTRPCKLPKLVQYGGRFSRPWHLYTMNGGVGRPDMANQSKGKKIAEALTARLAEVMVELSMARMNRRFPF
jgi:creatinine amidohydrolase